MLLHMHLVRWKISDLAGVFLRSRSPTMQHNDGLPQTCPETLNQGAARGAPPIRAPDEQGPVSKAKKEVRGDSPTSRGGGGR